MFADYDCRNIRGASSPDILLTSLADGTGSFYRGTYNENTRIFRKTTGRTHRYQARGIVPAYKCLRINGLPDFDVYFIEQSKRPKKITPVNFYVRYDTRVWGNDYEDWGHTRNHNLVIVADDGKYYNVKDTYFKGQRTTQRYNQANLVFEHGDNLITDVEFVFFGKRLFNNLAKKYVFRIKNSVNLSLSTFAANTYHSTARNNIYRRVHLDSDEIRPANEHFDVAASIGTRLYRIERESGDCVYSNLVIGGYYKKYFARDNNKVILLSTDNRIIAEYNTYSFSMSNSFGNRRTRTEFSRTPPSYGCNRF